MSSITMNDFSRLVGQTATADGEATFLKVSDGKLSQTGSVGNFFTTQSTRRETIDAFVGALRSEYGDNIANMINNTAISALRDSGKPLSARMVQDLNSLAQIEQNKLGAHNQEVVKAFLSAKGPENTFDVAMGQLLDNYAVASAQDRDSLREKVHDFLLSKANLNAFHAKPLTAADLQRAFDRVAPEFTGITLAHKSGLVKGLPGSLMDRMRLADMGLSRADDNNCTIERAFGALDIMRQIQPEGEITPETVYRALFKEAPPDGLEGNNLVEAIETRYVQDMEALLARAGKGDKDVTKAKASLINQWSTWIPSERLDSLVEHPDTVTAKDVAGFAAQSWSGRSLASAKSAVTKDCCRNGITTPGQPAPTFSFQLPDGKGGTKTESVKIGKGPDFTFANDADKAKYLKGEKNTLSDHLVELAEKFCGPDCTEEQLTNVLLCMGQATLLPLRHAVGLAGVVFDEHASVSVSFSRQPNGVVQANFSSPSEIRDTKGSFSMSLSIGKDGNIAITEFEIAPPLSVRQERALEAKNARIIDAFKMAEPFRALDDSPDGLFAQISPLALKFDPEARIEPRFWTNIDSTIGQRIEKMAGENTQPLTLEQIVAIRDGAVNEFFAKLEQAAGQVPEDQRAVFLRGCLELGEVPDQELLPAMGVMAGNVTNIFEAILEAKTGNEVRDLLSDLYTSMSSFMFDPDYAGKGADFFAPAHLLAMRLGMMELMDGDNPEGFAMALSRPGPFRDMLHSVADGTNEGNGIIQQALNWFNGGMAQVISYETLTVTLNPHEVRERDLSLSGWRGSLGEGVFVARLDNSMPKLAGLNQGIQHDMPAMKEHIRATAETDLREVLDEKEFTESGLTIQFVKDYVRQGIFVDGRYHDPSPTTSHRGTGTSEDEFIALFPNPQAAKQLSKLATQALPGIAMQAMQLKCSKETSEGIVENCLANPDLLKPANKITNLSIETLDANQGRYRLSAHYSVSSSNPKSPIEAFIFEVSVDVNLGDPPLPLPTVDDAHLDMIISGRDDDATTGR
ncbi:MAG: hypothetical protein LBP92_09960 [Deltaproteobacteria bacterium]|jgi:hypothetical protein|nr:hypothetical protein [Deltaproteobacteria bacterium]